jgi:hypothetical protein
MAENNEPGSVIGTPSILFVAKGPIFHTISDFCLYRGTVFFN